MYSETKELDGGLLLGLGKSFGMRKLGGFAHRDSELRLLVQWESGGQSCLEIYLLAGDGVEEIQKLGVQEIASIAGEAGQRFKRLSG